MSRRIARNAAVLTLSQGVSLTLNFVTWAYLARVLAPDRFGILGFGTALVAYFAVGVQLGFDAVVVREAAREPSRIPVLAGQLTALRLLLAAAALTAYAAVVLLLPRPPAFQMVLLVLGLQLVVLATRLNWTFQAAEEMTPVALRDAVVAALNAALVFTLVRRPEQVLLAAALTAGVPLLGNAWLFAAFRTRFGALRLSFDTAAWKALLRPAIPLAASAFLIEIYFRMDQVMLEFLYSTETVGLYSAAYRFISLTQLPANIAYAAFFPSLAAALGAQEPMRARGRMLARVLLPVGLSIALAGPWLARGILDLAYGPAYTAASAAFAVLIVNAGVVHVNMTVGAPLMAWNLQKPYMWAILGGAVANVGLNVLLIPPFGMTGAAVATLAAEMAVCAGLSRIYWSATGELPFGELLPALPVALGAAAAAVLGATLGWPVVLSAGLSIAVAAIIARTLGLLTPEALGRGGSAEIETGPNHPTDVS